MSFPLDFNLADVLGVAGSSIGIIIAGAILLGNFDSKYTTLCERYSRLTGEYRQNNASDPRKRGIRDQIGNYLQRIRTIYAASMCLMGAVGLFVITVAVASLSIVLPKLVALRVAGLVLLMAGLLLVGTAIFLGILDVRLSRAMLKSEVEDFSDIQVE